LRRYTKFLNRSGAALASIAAITAVSASRAEDEPGKLPRINALAVAVPGVRLGPVMGPLPDGSVVTPGTRTFFEPDPAPSPATMNDAAEELPAAPEPVTVALADKSKAVTAVASAPAPAAVAPSPAPASKLAVAKAGPDTSAPVAKAPSVASPVSQAAEKSGKPAALAAAPTPAAAPVTTPAQAAAPAPALAASVPPAVPPLDLDEPSTPAEPPAGATESLRDAIVASLKSNPEIQIALAQQDDAHYGVAEARAAYLPHVDLTMGYGREYAKSGTSASTERWRTEATLTVSQNVWDFGVTINDIKRARATYRSAQWGTREKIEAISYEITSAYLGVLLQQKLLELTQKEIEATQKIVKIVTIQKDLGLTTPADVGRAQARLENIQSALLDRKSALEQSRNAYKRLTDHLPARAVDLPPSNGTLPESADAAVDLMPSHSPRLAQAVEDRRSLDKQRDSQTGNFFPKIGIMVQGNYKYDVQGSTGRADDARAMVTMTYRLFNGGADLATRRRIDARLRQADYELDRRRREVEQDLRIDYNALAAAREKIATINAEIDSAQRVADLYRQQFREGRRTVFDLLDSQQILFAARTNQASNEIAMHAAEYRVLQKLGGLFDLVSGGEALPPLVVPAPGQDD